MFFEVFGINLRSYHFWTTPNDSLHDFASDTHVFSFVRPFELIFLKGFCITTPIVAGGKAAGEGLALAFSHFNFARVGS